jgi:hypothetical protein
MERTIVIEAGRKSQGWGEKQDSCSARRCWIGSATCCCPMPAVPSRSATCETVSSAAPYGNYSARRIVAFIVANCLTFVKGNYRDCTGYANFGIHHEQIVPVVIYAWLR